jgi:hypothetical protein
MLLQKAAWSKDIWRTGAQMDVQWKYPYSSAGPRRVQIDAPALARLLQTSYARAPLASVQQDFGTRQRLGTRTTVGLELGECPPSQCGHGSAIVRDLSVH